MLREWAKWALTFGLFILYLILAGWLAEEAVAKPPTKSKFYNFSEQLIDGQIRKPTALYINTREKARFERLLSLKKSFMRNLFETSKLSVFK